MKRCSIVRIRTIDIAINEIDRTMSVRKTLPIELETIMMYVMKRLILRSEKKNKADDLQINGKF